MTVISRTALPRFHPALTNAHPCSVPSTGTLSIENNLFPPGLFPERDVENTFGHVRTLVTYSPSCISSASTVARALIKVHAVVFQNSAFFSDSVIPAAPRSSTSARPAAPARARVAGGQRGGAPVGKRWGRRGEHFHAGGQRSSAVEAIAAVGVPVGLVSVAAIASTSMGGSDLLEGLTRQGKSSRNHSKLQP